MIPHQTVILALAQDLLISITSNLLARCGIGFPQLHDATIKHIGRSKVKSRLDKMVLWYMIELQSLAHLFQCRDCFNGKLGDRRQSIAYNINATPANLQSLSDLQLSLSCWHVQTYRFDGLYQPCTSLRIFSKTSFTSPLVR